MSEQPCSSPELCWWDHEKIEGEPVVRMDHSFCCWSCYEEWMESFL